MPEDAIAYRVQCKACGQRTVPVLESDILGARGPDHSNDVIQRRMYRCEACGAEQHVAADGTATATPTTPIGFGPALPRAQTGEPEPR